MNSERFIKPIPRVVINTAFNPGTLFDLFNTNLEWNPHNWWGNGANIFSTIVCTGLRAYAEIKKTSSPDAETDRQNWITTLARNPAFSTAAAGVTQLIVAGTAVATGNLGDAPLPLAFGIGDIVAAFNKDAQPEEVQAKRPPATTGTVIKDVLATAEIYFAYGLSTGQSLLPKAMFAAAAVLATARNIPFVSKQMNRLGWVGRQLNNPHTTFGVLTLGCCVVAANNNLHVALSYIGFGVAYSVIPTFKSGGLYEAAGHWRRSLIHYSKTAIGLRC